MGRGCHSRPTGQTSRTPAKDCEGAGIEISPGVVGLPDPKDPTVFLIPPICKEIYEEKDGLVRVVLSDGGQTFYQRTVNRQYKALGSSDLVPKRLFYWADDFREGLAAVMIIDPNDEARSIYKFIRKDGQDAFPGINFTFIKHGFASGYALVEGMDGKTYYVDKQGNLRLPNEISANTKLKINKILRIL